MTGTGLLQIIILLFTVLTQGQVGGTGEAAGNPSVGRGPSRPNSPLLSQTSTLPRGARQLREDLFEVTDPRPLEVAALLLSRKLGVAISFEEATWESSADVIRASAAGNRGGYLAPRGGTLTLIIPSNSHAPGADPRSIIQSALDSHRQQRNPGEFKVIQAADGGFSIVADRALNSAGVLVTQNLPLDRRISFPEMERSRGETLALIYKAAGLVNISPFADRFSGTVLLGANNETARDVLTAALHRPGEQKYAWRVRFDPETKIYGIYLVAAEEEVGTPGRSGTLRPLTWPQ